MRQKICILTSVHPALDVRIFNKEANSLRKAGYIITLIAPHDKNEILEGVKIIALPRYKNRFIRFFFGDKNLYRLALREHADIYHFHDPELLPWALLLKYKVGAKIIYDVHEDVPEQILSKEWLPRFVRKLVSLMFNQFEKNISRKFDYIITATPAIKNNFNYCNVSAILNYPSLDLLPVPINNPLNKKSKYILIYAGGLERVRGIKEITLSIGEINPKYSIQLKLVGNFSESSFENEIKNLNNNSKVEHIEWIPPKEVYQLISTSDIGLVCLHPLNRFLTSIPVKMFEYMGMGLPVIASDFSLWKEVIAGNRCGICVNPLNPKEIAGAIEYLIEHPENMKIMGENGRQAVINKYNWETESKKLLNIYQEICNK